MGHVEGRLSPSVARSLSDLEARDLISIAKGLPADWVVTVEPPYGQLSIGPLVGRRRFHRSWVASPSWGRLRRDDSVSYHGLRTT
jgi:hypothetical protein